MKKRTKAQAEEPKRRRRRKERVPKEPKYFCMNCLVKNDGDKCRCGRELTILAKHVRTKTVTVKVAVTLHYQKGKRKRILAKVKPSQHLIGSDIKLGEYRISSIDAAQGVS